MCRCIRGMLPSKSNYSLPPSLSRASTRYVWLKRKPEHTETCVSTQSNSGFMDKHDVMTANIYSTSYGVMPQSGAMSHSVHFLFHYLDLWDASCTCFQAQFLILYHKHTPQIKRHLLLAAGVLVLSSFCFFLLFIQCLGHKRGWNNVFPLGLIYSHGKIRVQDKKSKR